jgi:hypothetical protein
MKKLVLPLAILAMVGLLLGGVALDSGRMAAEARHRVDLADAELRKHEERLIKLLAGSKALSPEVRSAIAAYQGVDSLTARHAAFEELVVSFRQSMSTSVDPTNPLDRKFMDDMAGAINRREIAEKPFDKEWADYDTFLDSSRGRIARWFSPQAEADWKSGR